MPYGGDTAWEHGDDLLDAMPLFVLSLRARDELSLLALQAGWKPVASRRRERAEGRFLGSLARNALIDLRGCTLGDAGALIGSLRNVVETSGGAVVVIVDSVLEPELPELIAQGATHYLTGEVTVDRLRAALLAADRFAERVVGGLAAVRNRHAVQRSDALFWRWAGADRTLAISPALAKIINGLAPGADIRRFHVRDLVTMLDKSERAGAIAAIRRAVDDLMPSAFAHMAPGGGTRRFVHHLYPDPKGVRGEIEPLDLNRRGDGRDVDFLTGLFNRTGALGWIDQSLATGARVALVLLSLSEFDQVNSAYGRMIGDAMLSRVGLRLSQLVHDIIGPDAMIARVAGVEFLVAIVAPDDGLHVTLDRASLLATQMVAEMGRPFNAGDHLIRMSAHCGVAPSKPGDDAARLVRRAASALADARHPGTGSVIRVRVANRKSMELDAERLDADLRLALDRDEIQVLYQPQYDVATDAMVGVEALARWLHPVHGPIGAGALFTVASRSDFMLPLSDHIHATALRDAASWPDRINHLRLSLNVTAADIAQPDFIEAFLTMAEEVGFPRDRLTIELTESELVENVASAALLMGDLRKAGLRVAIDDFGTGYSSLAYLKSLPADYLKIDSTLTRDISGHGKDRTIVRAIIGMAKSLDLSVIAEGVETEGQLSALALAGCDVYQGFLKSPAVASNEIADMLAR